MENTLNAGVAVFFILSLFSWMIRSIHHSLKTVAFAVWIAFVAIAAVLMMVVLVSEPLHTMHTSVMIYVAMVVIWIIIYVVAMRGRS